MSLRSMSVPSVRSRPGYAALPVSRTSAPGTLDMSMPLPAKYRPLNWKPSGISQMPLTTARWRWAPLRYHSFCGKSGASVIGALHDGAA